MPSVFRHRCFVTALAILLAAFGAQAVSHGAASYLAVDIGSLGGQASDSTSGLALNKLGQITGDSTNALGNTDAFLYTPGAGMIDLGTLSAGTASQGNGLNDLGQVTGYSALNGISGSHAFLYTAGVGMSDLGTLSGPSGSSTGTAINNKSAVTGYTSVTAGINGGAQSGFTYSATGGGMTALTTISGGNQVFSNAINSNGDTAGLYLNSSFAQRAFLYRSGAMTDLGTLGGSASAASGINTSDQVTGFATLGNGNKHAFFYNGGPLQDLGTLGGDNSVGMGLNATGDVAGYSYLAGNGVQHAFLFSGGAMYDLNNLLSVGLAGAFLTQARAINDVGQILAESNTGRAYLLTPVPEPHAVALLALVGALALTRYFRPRMRAHRRRWR